MPVVVTSKGLSERADTSSVTVNASALYHGLKRTAVAVQAGVVEDHALTHLRVRISKVGLSIEATDRIRFARTVIPTKTEKPWLDGFIKRDDLLRLLPLLKKEKGNVGVIVRDRGVVVGVGKGSTYASEFRHVLSFPDSQAFVRPVQDAAHIHEVARAKLVERVKACLTLIRRLLPEDAYTAVTLNFNDKTLQCAVGQVKVEKPLPTKTEGHDTREVNGRFLLEWLLKCSSEIVRVVSFQGNTPIRLESGSSLYILAPIAKSGGS